MNYEQALEASKHNPKGVMKVLKGLEWVEYLKKQKGGVVKKWSWTPQVGEWCIDKYKTPKLITNVKEQKSGNWLIMIFNEYGFYEELATSVIPILEWQEIEEVLEKAGCWLEMNRPLSKYLKKNTMRVGCSIYQTDKLNYIVYAQGKSRQEAVYEAVLALGKEMK